MPRRATGLKMPARLIGYTAALLAATPSSAATCKISVFADFPVTMEGPRSSIPAQINGKDTRFWLDSGAFFSFMPRSKAAEFALPLEPAPFGLTMNGIGGSAAVEVATIKSFGIVGQQLRNVQFLVGGNDAGNGFIGRNILAAKDTEFDLADGSVKLIDPHDCAHTIMAYWALSKHYSTVPLLDAGGGHDFKLPVSIDGTKIEAALDTGAASSLLSRSAARRAGIDLSAPGVVATRVGGVGRHTEQGWVVPVANITIGDEQLLNVHLDVVDDSDGRNLPDMLLGADFIMAHHMYVARSQGRIWFTYSGGKAFRNSRESAVVAAENKALVQQPALPPGTQLAEAIANVAGDPKTADGYARRGAARLSARDLPGAIADLSEAIRQSPNTAQFYADRARAYAQAKNQAAETADIDQALALDPAMEKLLRARAFQRLARGDRAGALADAEAAARVTPPASLDSGRLAQLFVRLHQPARAVAMLDVVIAAHPDDADLDEMLNGRCWARALANVDLNKALADCNRAIRHNAGRADWFDSRGLVYFRLANYPMAISDYDAALNIFPKMAWSLYLRGLAKIALGHDAAGSADEAAAQAIQPKIVDEVTGFGLGVKPS